MNRRQFINLLTVAGLTGACRLPKDERLFEAGALIVQHWTLDLAVQEAIKLRIAAPLLAKVAKKQLHPNTDAACVLLHNETGDVLGYLATIQKGSQFDCASHMRDSGSVCKPLLYGAALETNAVDVDETFLDAKMSFPCTECPGHEYSPENYGGSYTNAQMTLSEALARSSNMVMLQVVRRMSLSRLLPLIAALDLPKPTNFNTMALGWDVSPLGLCGAIAALPNKGVAVRPRFIRRETVNGKPEEVSQTKSQPTIFSPQVSRYVIEAMRECLARGTGRAAADLSSRMAGKTGSSDSAWAVLCGPKITATLWIGRRDTNMDIGHTGGALAMPLLADVMRSLKRSRADLFPAWDS